MIKGALTRTGAKGLGGELPGQVFYGIQGPAGPKGDDYVLTDTDKAEIAEMAAELVEVPTPDSGGNVDLTGYATEQFVREGYQPKGDYLERSDKSEIVEEVLEQIPEGSGGAAIIDVVELPTENIREGVFYRLTTGTILSGNYVFEGGTLYCVDGLPEVGIPVTVDMTTIVSYYNRQDRNAYGYVDEMLSQVTSAPAGWYTMSELGVAFGVDYAGVVFNPNVSYEDYSLRILVSESLYVYDGYWKNLPYGYTLPNHDIRLEDHLDGYWFDVPGADESYYKVSDWTPKVDELLGYEHTCIDGYGIRTWLIDDNYLSTYYQELPFGYGIINALFVNIAPYTYEGITIEETGVYFNGNDNHKTIRLYNPNAVVPIDPKFIPPVTNVDLTGYAKEQWVQQNYQPKGEYLTEVPDGYAKTEDIPTKPEDIGAQPSGNYALKTEIPSVPVQSVNGKTGSVQLSASEVGARPDNWMPTAQEVGALPNTYTPPNQTAEQVGADPKGAAASAVSQHNASDDSHGDIRLELKAINDRLTAFFDSDNQTLDELSEIVAYITSNKSLIDSITTSKVSVADIVNNLTSNVSNKPLSAAQGVVLKGLIDALSRNLENYQPKGDYALRSELPTVPTKVSAFTNDAGYLTEHQDISVKADKSMPVDPNWEKWNDVRYYYGIDKNNYPIFNTFHGVLESDSMLSVRGGNGRWADDWGGIGGHVFEGWSGTPGNEKSRLTMLVGKFHPTHACIDMYSPPGTYSEKRRFGWVKLGCDEECTGVDISQHWTMSYTPLTLHPMECPNQVADYDLNPQLESPGVPVGTMYYDQTVDAIRVFTTKGWKTVKFEPASPAGPVTDITYYTRYYPQAENGVIAQHSADTFLSATFPLESNRDYKVTRSMLSPRFRIYLYKASSIDSTGDEQGNLVAQDVDNSKISELTFNSGNGFAMAVVFLSNKVGYSDCKITVEMT